MRARSLGVCLVAAAVVAAGCAPVQVVEVHTEPAGAAVYRIVGGARERMGEAPVRFRTVGSDAYRVVAEAQDHDPASAEVPGRDVQAHLVLALAPRGQKADELAILELLLIHGPLDAAGLTERAPALPPARTGPALAALVRAGAVRATAGDAPRYDLDMEGLRRLLNLLPQDAVMEHLLASRRSLARALAEAIPAEPPVKEGRRKK